MTPQEFAKEYYELPQSGIEAVTIKSAIRFAERYALVVNDSDCIHSVIPSLFKQRRESLKMSMQDVTNQTEIDKATISRIERGNDALFRTVMKLDKFYRENGV